ncbi:MAG: hypothetical protein IJG13_15210 [Kiritimatiellae bacterium]|nr:hypothetical protein [Kiritimatiellia bacterium]
MSPSSPLSPTSPPPPVIQMRSGQRRLFQLVEQYRLLGFIARRQYGKTMTCANIALMKMMKHRDHTVIFGSAKLNLSREIVRKEAAVFEKAISAAMAKLEEGKMQLADDKTGKSLHGLTSDDFADLFEHSRLEFRFYHSRSSYSRTKVVALRPDTVGETGDLMCDEVGRIGNWKDVWEAVEPIVASNPQFRILLLTTPPPDDAHYSFEQLAPPPGMKFPVSPSGNVYESVKGVTCLRVDAWDAYADGVALYDTKTAKPVTPEESRRRAFDKDAWDRNYGCLFITGGSAAVGLIPLMEAMERGERAGCVYAEDDLPPGWESLFDLSQGPIGIGADPATTEGEKSNPFGIAVTQRIDGRYVTKLILSFKSKDPKKPKAILRELATRLKAKAVAIDATSEVYWATEVREMLEGVCDVILVKNSEKLDFMGERVLYKTYLGQLLVNAIDEGQIDLPNDFNVKDDFRLVKKMKGGFDNSLDAATGRHGDLFDGTKNSLHALIEGTEEAKADAVQVGTRAACPDSRALSRVSRLTMLPPPDDDPATPTLPSSS